MTDPGRARRECDSCQQPVNHTHPQMTFAGEGDFGHCCVGDSRTDPETDCPDYVGDAA